MSRPWDRKLRQDLCLFWVVAGDWRRRITRLARDAVRWAHTTGGVGIQREGLPFQVERTRRQPWPPTGLAKVGARSSTPATTGTRQDLHVLGGPTADNFDEGDAADERPRASPPIAAGTGLLHRATWEGYYGMFAAGWPPEHRQAVRRSAEAGPVRRRQQLTRFQRNSRDRLGARCGISSRSEGPSRPRPPVRPRWRP